LEPSEFNRHIAALDGADITLLADALRLEHASADGEVCWWRATITVGNLIKRRHLGRRAGLAAHDAACAVQRAAERSVVPVERDDVTVVARAASEVARALVVGDDHELAFGVTETLFAPWHHVLAPQAVAA
jgi:hypothetical protein